VACRIIAKLLLLSYFEPRALEAIAQVNAISEHGKSGGLKNELLAVPLDVAGPAKGSSLKAFCDTPIASSIEI